MWRTSRTVVAGIASSANILLETIERHSCEFGRSYADPIRGSTICCVRAAIQAGRTDVQTCSFDDVPQLETPAGGSSVSFMPSDQPMRHGLLHARRDGREILVTTRSITRASFLAAMLGAGVLAIAPMRTPRATPTQAIRPENATNALRTLGDRFPVAAAQTPRDLRSLNGAIYEHAAYLRTSCSALRRVSGTTRPCGPNGENAFIQDYSIAVYETQLSSCSGSAIRGGIQSAFHQPKMSS